MRTAVSLSETSVRMMFDGTVAERNQRERASVQLCVDVEPLDEDVPRQATDVEPHTCRAGPSALSMRRARLEVYRYSD